MYGFVLGRFKMQYAVRVNAQTSEELQRAAFEAGFEWPAGLAGAPGEPHQQVIATESPILFFDTLHWSITHSTYDMVLHMPEVTPQCMEKILKAHSLGIKYYSATKTLQNCMFAFFTAEE